MPGTDRSPALQPAWRGAPGPRLKLVVARAELDAMIVQALAAGPSVRPTSVPATWLAHAPLTFQHVAAGLLALAGRFRAGAARRPAETGGPDADGVVVIAIAFGAAAPPRDEDAWEQWMRRHAPGFRLSTPALNPALAVLWLRADGVAAAACRSGDASGLGVHDAAAGLPAGDRWRAFDTLHLPGAGMLELSFGAPEGSARGVATPGGPAVHHLENSGPASEDVPAGRYSRLAGALGDAVLARLQRSRVAVVGLGRTGSTLAHSLARMGTSLLLVDPDVMEPHNLDGDLPPLLEGRSKAEAAARFVRGLMRPGADLDARALPIASPVAGSLLAGADMIVSCVDNDAARVWVSAWALALNKPHLDIATGLHPHGAEADLRLLPPGTGCLACRGGYTQRDRLALHGPDPLPPPTPVDFRQQRPGSLRSWGVMSAHAGLRMLELMVAGRIGHALFRRLVETAEGGLEVHDDSAMAGDAQACVFCAGLTGRGLRAVNLARIAALVAAWARPDRGSPTTQFELNLRS